MLTLILRLISNDSDLSQFSEILGDGGKIVVVDEGDIKPGSSIAEHYNEIVEKSDKTSDILLLSDNVRLCTKSFESMISCLYAAEKHAVVYGQEIENSESLIETGKKYLPEYTITINTNEDSIFTSGCKRWTIVFPADRFSSARSSCTRALKSGIYSFFLILYVFRGSIALFY